MDMDHTSDRTLKETKMTNPKAWLRPFLLSVKAMINEGLQKRTQTFLSGGFRECNDGVIET